MHEKQTSTYEHSDTTEAYETLLAHEPKFISVFVPTNAAEQKAAFLRGDVINPMHEYGKLDAIDFADEALGIEVAGQKLLTSSGVADKQRGVYEEFVRGYAHKLRMLKAAHDFNHAATEEDRQRAKEEYMACNVELYGGPDEATYRSLLYEKLAAVDAKELGEWAGGIRDELHALLSGVEVGAERFGPSNETVVWMHDVAEGLYGDMLVHVPEQATFTSQEVQHVFSEIIAEEFGDSARGWVVDIEPAQSINVKAAEKRIVIPIDRGEISRAGLRRLVVHELGVHMLRAITGESTDLEPLRTGLNNYYDAEEGLGKVMEQALDGKFAESGVDHYITAGLAGIDGKDFRQTFEAKWRLGVLSALKEGQDVTDEAIDKAKDAAYKQCMRMFRGTDALPWFKDLAYYNGAVEMWKHLEEIRGDDVQFTFVLLGKANPADIGHRRAMLESASK